jgi:hypothetical protein
MRYGRGGAASVRAVATRVFVVSICALDQYKRALARRDQNKGANFDPRLSPIESKPRLVSKPKPAGVEPASFAVSWNSA